MVKIAFAVTAVAAVVMTAPLLVGPTSTKAQSLKMAQGVDVQLGRDRDDRDRRRRNDSDVTIGVGPGGVTVGPRQNCRTVTTTVQRDDGRTITRAPLASLKTSILRDARSVSETKRPCIPASSQWSTRCVTAQPATAVGGCWRKPCWMAWICTLPSAPVITIEVPRLA